jgi:hypothetical protein
MLPKSDDRFDHELAGWFSLRRGAWYGTAAQLLASMGKRPDGDDGLWPQSSRELYAHLESHKGKLQSLGLDVSFHHGVPRMVSLRSCQNETLPLTPLADGFEVEQPASDFPPDVLSPVDAPQERPADLCDAVLPAIVAYKGDTPAARSGLAGEFGKGKYADGDKFEGRVFEETGEALFAIAEMRMQIQEQGLDLESAVDLVVGSARKITRSCGIAVGFLPQQESMGHPPQTGVAASTKGLHFHANLFRSTLTAGEAVLLPDARKHPVLGAWCEREGIGSVILVPIFHNREVAGAMEFLFRERRCFSSGDVMDLGLIAGVISGSFAGVSNTGVKQAERPESPHETKAAEDVEVQPELRNQKDNPRGALPSPFKDMIDDEMLLDKSFTPEPIVPCSRLPKSPGAPLRLWRTFKRAWVRPSRTL